MEGFAFTNKEVFEKLKDIPLSGIFESPRVDFLVKLFDGFTDNFACFSGWFKSELQTGVIAGVYNAEDAINAMSDLSLAGMFIGRRHGLDYALKRYGQDCFQFLLKGKPA